MKPINDIAGGALSASAGPVSQNLLPIISVKIRGRF